MLQFNGVWIVTSLFCCSNTSSNIWQKPKQVSMFVYSICSASRSLRQRLSRKPEAEGSRNLSPTLVSMYRHIAHTQRGGGTHRPGCTCKEPAVPHWGNFLMEDRWEWIVQHIKTSTKESFSKISGKYFITCLWKKKNAIQKFPSTPEETFLVAIWRQLTEGVVISSELNEAFSQCWASFLVCLNVWEHERGNIHHRHLGCRKRQHVIGR